MSYDMSSFIKKVAQLERLYRHLPNRAATIAVTFSKDRFRAQNWIDNRTEPWARRKETKKGSRRNRGRGLLVKSGRLKRSVRKIRVGPDIAIVGTDVPYAAAHNYGFRGKVDVKGKNTNFTRNMTLPRRQFLGESRVLASRIERDFASQVLKALK